MKLISLNAWGGRLLEPLLDFVAKQGHDTDIFSFQEINNKRVFRDGKYAEECPDLFERLQQVLPDFNGYFVEQVPQIGLATFVRKNLAVKKDEAKAILSAAELSNQRMSDGSPYYPRIVHIVTLENLPLTIYNFHGVPGMEKRDTPERDLQTKRLLEYLNESAAQKILTGDFNLNPDTEAIATIGSALKNLIKDYGITKTRNSHYKQHEIRPFADYAFVSPDVAVKKFEVLPDEISDHLALKIEFTI